MGQADELRKVMGKKQKDKIPIYYEKFLSGAKDNGIDEKLAKDIFAFVEPFAGYGFNKAHAAAYGWIAYQTAFLKANHPLAYFSALMTSVKDKTDKLVEYIDEAKKLGIPVLPPDVNLSLIDFAVVDDQIRFGLAAVKGIGEGAVHAVLAARANGPFLDFFDFARRVDTKHVNRRVFEALVKCGAFDTLPGNRAELLDAIDGALDVAARLTRERDLGQSSLFATEETMTVLAPKLRSLPPPTTMESLAWEKETLGVFISGHPLADVADALARSGAVAARDLRAQAEDSFVTVAGMLTAVRRTVTKAQAQMLIATLEDMTGSVEMIVFPKQYQDLQAKFVQDAIVVVKGRLRTRERRGATPGEDVPVELTIQVNEIAPFTRPRVERRAPSAPAGWHVTVGSREEIDALALLLDEWPGTVPVTLRVNGDARRLPRGLSAEGAVREQLMRIVGPGNVAEGLP